MAQCPDYDWEMDNKTCPTAVSCVSLGSYCAVASCLSHLKLREAAYPFDWNRTSMQGVIHFLKTGFADFLQFLSVKDFPGGQATGGKAYCGAHHSVWHEDLATEDGTMKYQRRIKRFYENNKPRMLFIRVLNANTEILDAKALLQTLQGIFANSRVYLLLIVVCQPVQQSFIVGGTGGRLLMHCTPHWSADGLGYAEAIRAAHKYAATCEGVTTDLGPEHGNSCEEVLARIDPFFGGPPQQVPFFPRLLQVRVGTAPPVVQQGLVQTVAAPPQQVAPAALTWKVATPQGTAIARAAPGTGKDEARRGEGHCTIHVQHSSVKQPGVLVAGTDKVQVAPVPIAPRAPTMYWHAASQQWMTVVNASVPNQVPGGGHATPAAAAPDGQKLRA